MLLTINLDIVVQQILLIGFIQGFIVIGIFLVNKRIAIKTYLYINLLILFFSLNNLQAWLNSIGFSFHNYYLDNLYTPWYILIAPIFYLFVSEFFILNHKKTMVRLGLFWFIFSSLVKIFTLVRLRNLPHEMLSNYLWDIDRFTELIALILYVYVVYSVMQLLKKPENHKQLESYKNLRWLETFIKIGGIVIVLWGVALMTNIYSNNNAPALYDILRIAITLYIYWILYRAIYAAKDLNQQQTRDLQNNMDNKKDFETIQKYFADTEAFTNPYLNIEEVAEGTQIAKTKIPKLIALYTGLNFTGYLKSLRVQKAKKMLLEDSFEDYTIESIGIESGFLSRSSFYSAFKKHTGLSPSNWRKDKLQSNM